MNADKGNHWGSLFDLRETPDFVSMQVSLHVVNQGVSEETKTIVGLAWNQQHLWQWLNESSFFCLSPDNDSAILNSSSCNDSRCDSLLCQQREACFSYNNSYGSHKNTHKKKHDWEVPEKLPRISLETFLHVVSQENVMSFNSYIAIRQLSLSDLVVGE